jgi:hypothetical protein
MAVSFEAGGRVLEEEGLDVGEVEFPLMFICSTTNPHIRRNWMAVPKSVFEQVNLTIETIELGKANPGAWEEP